jgi:hypothetical protein
MWRSAIRARSRCRRDAPFDPQAGEKEFDEEDFYINVP